LRFDLRRGLLPPVHILRFRGGLVFKAHRHLYHSTLGSRVIKKKKINSPASAVELLVQFYRCIVSCTVSRTGLQLGVQLVVQVYN